MKRQLRRLRYKVDRVLMRLALWALQLLLLGQRLLIGAMLRLEIWWQSRRRRHQAPLRNGSNILCAGCGRSVFDHIDRGVEPGADCKGLP